MKRQQAKAQSPAAADLESAVPPRVKRNSSPSSNPFITILHKVCLLIVRDVQHTPSGNYIQDFTKDVAIGTLCGVIFILFFSFLGSTLPFRSTTRLRSAAYELISDPEWMKTIEDNIDVRLIDMDLHKAILREIAKGGQNYVENPEYQTHLKSLEQRKQQIENAKKEYKDLLSELGVDLNRWCGACKEGFGYCKARLDFIKSKYGTPETKVKISIMSEGKCIMPSQR